MEEFHSDRRREMTEADNERDEDASDFNDQSDSEGLQEEFEEATFPALVIDHSNIKPYRFEPELDEAPEAEAAAEGDEQEDPEQRLGNSNWCSCSGPCSPMPTVIESQCCKEIEQIVMKMDECAEDTNLNCITEHPGFDAVCLNLYVLETAYFQYKQQYGADARLNASEHEKNRHCAYRQMARWCWNYLGRHVRVPLPSCAVTKIRKTFQSETYTGFKSA